MEEFKMRVILDLEVQAEDDNEARGTVDQFLSGAVDRDGEFTEDDPLVLTLRWMHMPTEMDRTGARGRPRSERDRAVAFIQAALSAGPVLAEQMFNMGRARGISVKTLRRAAKDEGIVKTPPGGGVACKWSLP